MYIISFNPNYILVSDVKYISQKGVIEYDISDHNIIFFVQENAVN